MKDTCWTSIWPEEPGYYWVYGPVFDGKDQLKIVHVSYMGRMLLYEIDRETLWPWKKPGLRFLKLEKPEIPKE